MANDVFVSLPDGRWHIDKIVEKLQQRIATLSADQVRLVNLIDKMVSLDKTRAKAFDVLSARSAVHLDYIERLENLVAQCCAKLNIPVPFPGQDDDFGLSPRPKKAQCEVV